MDKEELKWQVNLMINKVSEKTEKQLNKTFGNNIQFTKTVEETNNEKH